MKKSLALLIALVVVFCSLPQTPASAASAPPATWQEHWFEHKELVNLAYYDDDVAVYLDSDIDRNKSSWINSLAGNVWRYTKQNYGSLGGDGRLYVIVHNKKYSGGHPGYAYNADHDYRNTIDIGGSDFSSPTGWNLDILVHEVGHIVESATNGAKGSPAFNLWGDSKWAEIYQYDVYRALGLNTEADRIYNSYMAKTESFPQAGTYWFKNWFYPAYNNYGKNQMLSRYFQLVAQYYPKNSSGNFTRDMNMGEFVHFMSGAARADLKSLAMNAFGWTDAYESQYQAARREFSQITYGDIVTIPEGAVFYQDANYGGAAVALGVGSYNFSEMVAAGIPNDSLSSVKVTPGIKVTLYQHENFGGAQMVITSNTPSLGDFNDAPSSLKVERTGEVPTFYADPAFAGTPASLGAGTYNVNDIISKGIANDSLSSVKVPRGYKVTLYNDKDYSGGSKVLLADSSSLEDFNDKTSSIKVEPVNLANLEDAQYTLTSIINNKVVCADNFGNDPLIANRDTNGGAWETFGLVKNGDGTVSFRAGANGNYVTAVIDEQNQLLARAVEIQGWEKFYVEQIKDNEYAIYSTANGKYVTVGEGGKLFASKDTIDGPSETFHITKVL